MEDKKKEKEIPVTSAGTEAATSMGRRRKAIPKRFIYIAIAVIIVVLLVIGGRFLLTSPDLEEEGASQPTPTDTQGTPTPTLEEVDKSDVSIRVLNGTGIGEAAGDLQDELEKVGYSDIEVGNADDKDYEKTPVVFDEDLPESAKREILALLRDFYSNVDESTDSLDDFDVEIITGYPIGHTPTPTEEPKATSAPTPTSTESATPTP
jgi:hypothetical protein